MNPSEEHNYEEGDYEDEDAPAEVEAMSNSPTSTERAL